MTTATSTSTRVTMVPVEQIRVGARLREQSDVSDLKASIEKLGLLHPIVVNATADGFALVAGRHRLQAVTELGHSAIPAIVREFDAIHAELAEIDENLTHHTLTVLEQGEHLARRNELLRQLGLRAARGDNQHGGPDTVSGPPVTTADIAAELGLSDRTVRRHVGLAEALPQDVRDAVRATPVANRTTDLLTLARLQPEKQREVAEVIAQGVARTVGDALRKLAPVTAEEPEAEEFSPSDGPGADVGERLKPIRVAVNLRWQGDNPMMRTRTDAHGNTREYPREAKWFERDIEFAVTREALEPQGGASTLARAIASNVYAALSQEGWPEKHARTHHDRP